MLQFDPCASDYLLTYLNRADVQKALHAREDTKWRFCGGVVYNYGDSLIAQEPKYEYLCQGNYSLKMAIYSGDDDTNCGMLMILFVFYCCDIGVGFVNDVIKEQWVLNIGCGI